jgi:transglutaminase-like putative cysteine protease
MAAAVMPQTRDHYRPRRYRVSHRTRYGYDRDVEMCYERGMLQLRDTPTQRVASTAVTISPEAGYRSDHLDHFGNHAAYIEVRTPHRTLDVALLTEVEVAFPRTELASLDQWTVGSVGGLVRALDPLQFVTYAGPSPFVGRVTEVAAFGAEVLHPDRPLGSALMDLMHAIHDGFAFTPGATDVGTSLLELLELRAGVCQDFTHLAIGVLRAFGVPARYVSGYLETLPPPGRPKLMGSDATHAWVSVPLPDGRWIDIDPTNDQFADSRYIVSAWGRDFGDVSPLKGVLFTTSTTSTLDVAVDVIRL